MNTITVNIPQHRYQVLLEEGLLARCGRQIAPFAKTGRAVIVSDSNVAPLYAGMVASSLADAGVRSDTIVFPAGEASKNHQTLLSLYTQILALGFTRSDLLIALGGGVTGDMAGFAAATLFRGMDYVQIPTTLLAQVDSSVGGKVAVDLPEGKNLVGAFLQPKCVIVDPTALDTLPPAFLTDGLGEVIKYGCIKDQTILAKLRIGEPVSSVIPRCIDIKRQVVELDEFDRGGRMILNFGHTIGHAIEKLTHYQQYSHGVAVAIGMYHMARIGEEMGITADGCASELAAVLDQYGIPRQAHLDAAQIAAAARGDKKRAGDTISLVFLKEMGSALTEKFSVDRLKEIFALCGDTL